MSFKSLMVYVDPEPASGGTLSAARALAERFDADVIGVAAGDRVAPFYFEEGAYAAELIERERAEIQSNLAKVEQRFRTVLAPRADRIEWRSTVAFPAPYLARQARAADLLMVQNILSGFSPVWNVNAGDILMTAGRPVLIIPDGGTLSGPGKILIAWKESREARRALADALPLLRNAAEVTVVAVLEDDARGQVADQLHDVQRWLERHGVRSAVRCENARAGTAEDLLAIASEVRADLIVSGAYGHSRIGEWAFGGVTRALLKRSSCPLLMSH